MTSPRQRRKGKREVRRNYNDHWYHHVVDFIADILWLGVDIPWYIISGIFRVLFAILKGFGRVLMHILEGIGDIFSAFT